MPFEEKWVIGNKDRPSIWFRYGDDTFTLLHSKDKATRFISYLNDCHYNQIPFLDILIKRHITFLHQFIERKLLQTFTQNGTLLHHVNDRVNLIRILTFRCFRICSFPILLESSLNELRKLLSQNGYPRGVVNHHTTSIMVSIDNKANPRTQ